MMPSTASTTAIVYCCCVLAFIACSDAFASKGWMLQQQRGSTQLHMAKKLKNKQFELAKKLAEAKKQKAATDPKAAKLSKQEIKERNDRLRFEELLETRSGSTLNDYSSDGYLNREQEEEEINAARRGVERLFEGDPAPTEVFESLVQVTTSASASNALGPMGAKRIVPWLPADRGTGAKPKDYLIVVCDPRLKSPYLQQTVRTLNTQLPMELRKRLIVVNADTPAENRRFIKKNGIDKVDVFSDEKMEWMRAYSALGAERLTMTMFVVGNEQVKKLARDLDPDAAIRVITNAVKNM
uniref:DUF4174 domain-containing protein n=1 Tax=Craspedostauros australis TaxID=1486917 RepID=A0A7R9ZL38_9STRA|mmetsp:Transcript_13127/g.36258  ORF Transcript_13127/g.36258 Transcript_13127/m.36258 type:complete len:297 (+) Transcript_13127:140-1030(+)